MYILHCLSLLATIASLAASQQFVPVSGTNTFPKCAVGCPVIMQMQALCTPPNHVQGTELSYEDCFCQTPSLQDLYTTGETVCTSQCTATADRQKLSDWFKGFCKQVASGVDPAGSTSSAATTLTTSTTSGTAATGSATTTAVITGPVVDDGSANTGPWIKTHWQWVIMLLFLFFGLLALGLGARWLKNRHDRKMAQSRAAKSGFPVTEDKRVDRDRALTQDMWGPHQHMAATKGYQYTPNGVLPMIDENENTKGGKASRVEVTEIESTPSETSHSKTSRSPH